MAYDDQLDGGKRLPNSAEVLSKQPQRDTYGPDHGSGNPHMNWDDKPLKDSNVWQSHRSAKPKK